MAKRRPIGLVPPSGWSLLGAGLVSLSIGCSAAEEQAAVEGGQTGSAGCDVSPRCICDAIPDADIARGVVSFDTKTTASVEVLEVFGTNPRLAVGNVLTGSFQVGFPCGLGNLPALADGSEVLVSYQPSSSMSTVSMFVVEWQDTLMLTPKLRLAAEDAGALSDMTACREHFPDREVVCNDNF